MPADRRSKFPQTGGGGRQTMVNYIGGGRGGPGGGGHGTGTGGAGGRGMGPSLSFEISVGQFTMHNNVHGDDDWMHRDLNRQNAVGGDPMHSSRSGPLIHQNIHNYGDRGTLTTFIRLFLSIIDPGIDILHRSVALEGIHDSMDSFPQPKCHPETRTQMLKDLRKWAIDPYPNTTILWLYGPAGAGKSAIMRTLATQLHEDGRLGGCFFFKRGHGTRGNAKAVIPTIAYQLAIRVPWLRARISQIIENDPSIVGQCIASQMENLILGPCHSHEPRDPVAILIDGLDECEGHGFQHEILRAIRNTASSHLISPRFIIASRPEPHIREMFNAPLYFGHYRSVNVEQSFEDVRKYLSDEFARIHHEHATMRNIVLPWPSDVVLRELVFKSSGHFIYASTIIKFIDDKNHRPTQRLAVVKAANSTGCESAFKPLDQLYMTILNSAPRHSELIPILCAIANFQLGAEAIDQILRLEEGETRLRLRGLHSVLHIPPELNEEVPFRDRGGEIFLNDQRIIRSHHASFLEFLDSPSRSRDFCVSVPSRLLGRHWIPFVVSLPPSVEAADLCPLIASINPINIFELDEKPDVDSMTVWLRDISSVSRELIKLWEDYESMVSLEEIGFFRVLVSLVMFPDGTLSNLRRQLGWTWPEIRTWICGPSSNIARHQYRPSVLAARLAFRDVALQCIRKMVQNQLDMSGQVYSWESQDAALESIRNHPFDDDTTDKHKSEQRELVLTISYLVRSSPPCPVLYRELWAIPIVPIWSCWLTGTSLIYHVSKWLQSFPNPTMELVAFWMQAGMFNVTQLDNTSLHYAEKEWKQKRTHWNQTVDCLAIPKELKLL
ncbi:NACHT domain-containing protein [Mycena sanguinolenta]|uniref:NACHT domain-containing protein n=1 Tax=Mycena sanguinolenta TaxID=230812 RepID=A0A8H6ZC43_9AGAR|nr:NACHT domain-containing protein [Mycena sanguinolenta]